MSGYNFPVDFAQIFAHGLDSNVNITDSVMVEKKIWSQVMVDGNTGISNAKADAIGYNTLAETVNTTWSIQNYGSGAYGSSTSSSDADVYGY